MPDNRYFYYDDDVNSFLELLPRRLEVFVRALALVAGAFIVASILFPRLVI